MAMLACAVTAAVATALAPEEQNEWKMYNGHKLSLRYPDSARAYTMAPKQAFAAVGCGYSRGNIIFCMLYPSQSSGKKPDSADAYGTRLMHSTVTVSLRSDIRTASGCNQYIEKAPGADGNGYGRRISPVTQDTINGATFYKLSGESGEPGHHMIYNLYHTFRENTCYEIMSAYFTAYTPAPDGKADIKVPQKVIDQVKAQLDRIISTIAFIE
jgi:hypothetical protein